MSKDTSGPAFPTVDANYQDFGATGMTIRQYAAIKAMPVVLAEAWRNEWDFDGFDSFDQMVARHACNIADALLAELEK